MDHETNKAALEKGIINYKILRKTKLEANQKKRIFAYIRCGQACNDKIRRRELR